MLVDRWRRIESLFLEALSKTPVERQEFLDRACSNDFALRLEVESLLAHEGRACDFLESEGASVEEPSPRDRMSAGQQIGPYNVIEMLGAGGMGEVYRAQDPRLEREVALKFLLNRIADDAASIERFRREARAVSALNHPNICTVYDVGESGGRQYIVMELLEGQSLKDRITGGPLSIDELTSIGSQVCSALQAAHDKGIVHRDLKPANLLVSKTGRVKVLDFGLAKREGEAPPPNAPVEVTRSLTLTGAGAILGTLAYMSPEQAVGEKADARSDIFSLAVVLYEMATGRRPFGGKTPAGMIGSLLTESPARPSAVNSKVPRKLDRVILKGLEKNADNRYASASELAADLAPWGKSENGRRNAWIAALMAVVALVAGAFLLVSSWQRERQRVAADVANMIEHDDFAQAFLRAQAARGAITEAQWDAMSTVVRIDTTPPGVEVRWKMYSTPDAPWQSLGRSPLAQVRLPLGILRVEMSSPGYDKLERVLIKWNRDLHDSVGEVNLGQYGDRIHFELSKAGALPPGMVVVPAGPFGSAYFGFKPFPMDTYLIDKFEVTNWQYKNFIDQGAYRNRAWWKQPILKDGRELNWEEAMRLFRDATGRPGPATWSGGTYPSGQDDYPVGGVSWYEAAAYAAFAGKSLPTIQHWHKAALVWMSSRIVPLSNFRGSGPVAVGRTQGLGPFGTYDMAGNVKEWCWNEERSGKRYLLGGAWDSEGDWLAFGKGEVRQAIDRLPTSGFRCVRYSQPPPKDLTAPLIHPPRRDYSKEKPVSDEAFESHRYLYLYERGELHAKVEAAEQSAVWRKEKVTFLPAYGDQRMTAYLFVPKSSQPPYQTVVFMPWVTAMYATSSANLVCMEWVNFVIKSGRAVLYPVYAGTYERRIAPWQTPIGYRDWVIMVVKDLNRSVDYLETRTDIRQDSLAYYGASMGASFGPYLALEKRFKAAVLADGAFVPFNMNPSVDPATFAPRVKIPVLMINGRYDWVESIEDMQKPMFRAFGTPAKDKRHVLLEATHYSLLAGEPFTREVLGWFDKYLGPVQ